MRLCNTLTQKCHICHKLVTCLNVTVVFWILNVKDSVCTETRIEIWQCLQQSLIVKDCQLHELHSTWSAQVARCLEQLIVIAYRSAQRNLPPMLTLEPVDTLQLVVETSSKMQMQHLLSRLL